MPGWSDRVKIVSGSGGYAYVPGELLIKNTTGAEQEIAEQVLGVSLNLKDQDFGEGYVQKEAEAAEATESEAADTAESAAAERLAAASYLHFAGYDRDVPSAVRQLRGAGLIAQPNHVFFADNSGEGNSVYANHVFGNPVYGNPVYGNPVYGNPVYGNPVYGNPVYGNPVYGNPVYGNPVYGNPVYGNPVYGNPVYGNPVYGNSGRGAGQGPHCGCEGESCARPSHSGAASAVYPNPVYARAVYTEKAAVRYETTGIRPSNAIPLFVGDHVELPDLPNWNHADVRVAVIDTGWSLPINELGEGVSVTASAFTPGIGDRPDTESDGYLDPVAGHGVFIAGLVQRYAPKASVKVIKALTTYGDGDEAAIAQVIDDLVADDYPPHIISMSFGTYAPEEPERLAGAVQAAIAAGILVVASAGNDGTSNKQYPAAFPGVISVGALGPNGPAPFSNWGDWVRACAPGVDIPSSFWTFDGKSASEAGADNDLFEGWALWSGTSFSAPIVAAALAQTMQRGLSGSQAVEVTIDNPSLYRLPCFGTVINPPPAMSGL